MTSNSPCAAESMPSAKTSGYLCMGQMKRGEKHNRGKPADDRSAKKVKQSIMGFRAIPHPESIVLTSMGENAEQQQKMVATDDRTLLAFRKKSPPPPTEPDLPPVLDHNNCYKCWARTIVENDEGELVCTTCALVQVTIFVVD